MTCVAPASRRNHSLRRIALGATATQGSGPHLRRTSKLQGTRSSNIKRRTSTIKNTTSELPLGSRQEAKLRVSVTASGKSVTNRRMAVAHIPVSSQITTCSGSVMIRIVEPSVFRGKQPPRRAFPLLKL